jgi:hypothetical protein
MGICVAFFPHDGALEERLSLVVEVVNRGRLISPKPNSPSRKKY